MSPRSAREATIVGREDLAPGLAFFRVRPEGTTPPFVPGQYVTLGLPAAGGVVERAYSIASSARRLADGYELYIRLVAGGTLTPVLFGTRPGARVSLRAPKGRFTLARGDGRVHLLVASGCGIAPFASMLRTLRDEDEPRRVVLLHGVSYARELAYADLFEELARDARWRLTYVPTVSRPRDPSNAGWRGRTGRVESAIDEVCDDLWLAPRDTVAYLCGNPQMIAAAEAVLLARGVGPERIHHERYWPARGGLADPQGHETRPDGLALSADTGYQANLTGRA